MMNDKKSDQDILIHVDTSMDASIRVVGNTRYLEGEISVPKWTQSEEFALALKRAICITLRVKEDDVRMHRRLMEVPEKNKMQPAIRLVLPKKKGLLEGVPAVIERFCQRVKRQGELELQSGPHKLTDETARLIDEEGSVFLAGHGGEQIAKPLYIETGGQIVSSVKGTFADGPGNEPKPDSEIEVLANYDGRKLSTRVSFFKTIEPRPKELVIPYDFERFDPFFRVLHDDKDVVLKVRYRASGDDNKPLLLLSVDYQVHIKEENEDLVTV